MITTALVKGKEFQVITQQYQVGLYVAIYKQGEYLPQQLCLDIPEKEFHLDVRAGKFLKGRIKIVPEKSSVIA